MAKSSDDFLFLAEDFKAMGLMRFVVSPPQRISDAMVQGEAMVQGDAMVQGAYLSGMDRAAWPGEASASGGELVIRRTVSDSARLQIPWEVEGYGRVTLSTSSLMEQFEAYQLPLELARGTIAQLRDQLADWQMIGLSVPEKVHAVVSEAIGYFGRAALMQDDPPASAELAQRAIRTALDGADLLVAAYVDQTLAARHSVEAKLPTLLGGNLGVSLLEDDTARQFLLAFNAAAVPVCWREIEASEGSFYWTICDKQIEWCRTHGLAVCGGPL
ncbi:MAG: hypothetical protein HQ567_00630, partial [Candidatus Nealsonbacteria bacterium]|nr:hypothetical protein [Candidatus Nealsonbacteria bacterium]